MAAIADDLLQVLRQLGIELRGDGDGLPFRAPRGALTPELRAELAERRDELLHLLGAGADGPPAAGGIARAGRDRPLPLSFAQERLWFLEQLSAEGGLYNLG